MITAKFETEAWIRNVKVSLVAQRSTKANYRSAWRVYYVNNDGQMVFVSEGFSKTREGSKKAADRSIKKCSLTDKSLSENAGREWKPNEYRLEIVDAS